eukprot:scaffold3621_cov115-Skeletonema_dohrnii-CCMP3373.AAC.5
MRQDGKQDWHSSVDMGGPRSSKMPFSEKEAKAKPFIHPEEKCMSQMQHFSSAKCIANASLSCQDGERTPPALYLSFNSSANHKLVVSIHHQMSSQQSSI